MEDYEEDYSEEVAELVQRWDEQYDSTHMGDYERYEYLPVREE